MPSLTETPDATAPLVALDGIVPDPEQPRKTFPPGPLQQLADKIWVQGLIQPITLTPSPDGGPDTIFVGERRVRAFHLNRERSRRLLEEDPGLPDDHPARWYLSWTAIPALYRPPMPSDVRLMLQIAENDDRDDLTLYERALAVHQARQFSGKSGKDFAKEHGLDPSVVSGYKVLANSKGPTKAALEQGLLRGLEAARLFMRIPADRQELLIAEATEGESFLTRPMLAKIVENLERAEELSVRANRAAAPPKPPKPTQQQEPLSAQAPVLSLETLVWLEERLRPEHTSQPEPQQLDAHAVLHQAILASSAFIVISEESLDELRSPNQESYAA